MCKRIDSICQKEFETRLQSCQRIHHKVIFDNQKETPIDVEYIDERFCSAEIATSGILSFSDSLPLWSSIPEIIDNQTGPCVPYPYILSSTLTGIGHTSGIVELSAGKTTMRFVKSSKLSPKVYRSGWVGGSPARIRTYKVSTLAKGLGRRVFYVGVVIDGYGLLSGTVNPVKAVVNIGVATAATFGGPIGLTVGLIYWGLDLLGVFDERPAGTKVSRPEDTYTAPIDNLRVANPTLQYIDTLNTP